MNYYEHHIGDYAEATAHLSFVEDAAYSRLIRKYYATEKALPGDLKSVQRLVAARSKEERDAVASVLAEFFDLRDDGWHQPRCDIEITRFQDKAPDRNAKRENERERQRRARERRKQIFDALREVGVIPAFDAPMSQLTALMSQHNITQESQPVTRDVTTPVTRDVTANQTPDTKHQTPSTKEGKDDDSAAPPLPSSFDPIHARAIEVSVLLRKRGAAVTADNPGIREMAMLGFSDAQLLTALETAQAQRHDRADATPINAGYLLSIVKNPKPARETNAANETPEQTRARHAEAKRLAFGGQPPGDVIDA